MYGHNYSLVSKLGFDDSSHNNIIVVHDPKHVLWPWLKVMTNPWAMDMVCHDFDTYLQG